VIPLFARHRLGIPADAAAPAIRRAYADALRALDVEADPEGFVELREARDTALAAARTAARATTLAPDPADLAPAPDPTGEGTDLPPLPATGLSEPPACSREGGSPEPQATPLDPHPDGITTTVTPTNEPPQTPDPRLHLDTPDLAPDPDDVDLHAGAIWRLLLPQGEPVARPLAPDELVALHAHLDALLTHPQLEALDGRTRAEGWLADLIDLAGPRADPMLLRAVTFFGWDRDRGALHQPPAIAAALARHDDKQFLSAVTRPGHRFHRAWLELTGHRGWGNLLVGRRRARDLVATIRRDHPALEAHLDGYKVGKLDTPPSGSWRTAVFAIWIVIAIARFALSDNGATPATPRPIVAATFTTPDADLDPALRAVGGPALTAAALARANPAYLRHLRGSWAEAKRTGRDPTDFAMEVMQDVGDRAGYARRTADYDTVTIGRRLQLDQARAIRDRLGTLACADYLNGEAQPDSVMRPFRDRQRDAIGRTILGMNGVPEAQGDGSFRIPGDIADSAAARAGLSRKAFGAAMTGKGPEPTRCTAWIALLETALALPPDKGAPILRAM